jgi:hypothetical protein
MSFKKSEKGNLIIWLLLLTREKERGRVGSLENGAKIEPYTIIIMATVSVSSVLKERARSR